MDRTGYVRRAPQIGIRTYITVAVAGHENLQYLPTEMLCSLLPSFTPSQPNSAIFSHLNFVVELKRSHKSVYLHFLPY
jgi:hypothetical protein